MINAILFASLLFFCLLIAILAGRILGLRYKNLCSGELLVGGSAIEGAVFGLLALMIAFTFSGAASRFNERRNLIVEEANAIGTAYLRLDLLPSENQVVLREKFHQYLDARLKLYGLLAKPEVALSEVANINKLQMEIWSIALNAATKQDSPAVVSLIATALNEMIDIATTRTEAIKKHPPLMIFVVLFILSLIAALIAGYNLAAAPRLSWLHVIIFSATISMTVYLTLDIEYPRFGFVRIDGYDQVLRDLRYSMVSVKPSADLLPNISD